MNENDKNERQQMDQALHRVATKERKNIKRTTKQKAAGRHSKEGGTTWNRTALDRQQWKVLMEGYNLQWMDNT